MNLLKRRLSAAIREVYECLHLANCEKGPIAATLYGLCVNAETYLKMEDKHGTRIEAPSKKHNAATPQGEAEGDAGR